MLSPVLMAFTYLFCLIPLYHSRTDNHVEFSQWQLDVNSVREWCMYMLIVLAIIGSDNDLSPYWAPNHYADLLPSQTVETNFSEIWIKIQ